VSDRPRVGISACLLGEPVRYDAGHKRDAWLVDALGPQVEWVPVCPEVEAGFGTPRETMEFVRADGGGVALMTTETKRDVTEMMHRYTDRRIDELARAGLDGYVLKADSPSCGIEGVPVFGVSASAEINLRSTGRGLLAEALLSRLPHLPVADERQLADPAFRTAFIARILAHRDRRSVRL
jgi:uncharacterized protein YbbK (DUF523 family)